MPQTTVTHRPGTALRSPTHRFGETQKAGEHADPDGFEARSLLARLGLPAAAVAPGGPALPAAECEEALSRLRAEGRRLARHARARHPAYDLNRHIAVRRLIEALAVPTPERSRPRPSAPGAEARPSNPASAPNRNAAG